MERVTGVALVTFPWQGNELLLHQTRNRPHCHQLRHICHCLDIEAKFYKNMLAGRRGLSRTDRLLYVEETL